MQFLLAIPEGTLVDFTLVRGGERGFGMMDELNDQRRLAIEHILMKFGVTDTVDVSDDADSILDQMLVYGKDGLPVSVIELSKHALDFADAHLMTVGSQLVTDAPDAIDFTISVMSALLVNAPLRTYLRQRRERIDAFVVDLWVAVAFELGSLPVIPEFRREPRVLKGGDVRD